MEAVQQVTVEELSGPAFVPDFDGAGWDPLWLPVVTSETEFFIAGMAGFGDVVEIPLPPHSSREPRSPLPCGGRPVRHTAGGALAALALPGGMHDWFVIAAAVAAMILAFMCCCHRRIRPRPPPPAQEESERPLLTERPLAPDAPAPLPPATTDPRHLARDTGTPGWAGGLVMGASALQAASSGT